MIQSDIRRISILLPFVCLIFGLAVAYSQYRRLQGLEGEHETLQSKKTQLEQAIKKSNNPETLEKIAAFPQTTSEEPSFLNRLKELAATAGVQILRWSSTSKPAGIAPGGDPNSQPAALKGITQIDSKIDIAGPYNAVRNFNIQVRQSARLLTVNDTVWTRDPNLGTKLSMTLSRYVTPPTAGSPDGAAAASGNLPAGGSQ